MKRIKQFFAKIIMHLLRHGCPYCADIAPITGEDNHYGQKTTDQFFWIEGRRINYFVEYEDGTGCDDFATINRCPMCGKKLHDPKWRKS